MKQFTKIVYFIFLFFQTFSQAQNISRKDVVKQIETAGQYYVDNHFEKSLLNAKIALLNALKINDDELVAQSYNSIAVIYDEFKQFDRAIEIYEKSLKYAYKAQNDTLLSWINNNLGTTYYLNNIDLNKGIDFLNKSLFYANKINDSAQIVSIKLNIVNVKFESNLFNEGYLILNEIKKYLDHSTDLELKFYYYKQLGQYYSFKNDPKKALTFFKNAENIASIQLKNRGLIPSLYNDLSQYYSKINQIEKSKFYADESKRVEDSLFADIPSSELEKAALKIQLNEYINQLEKIENSILIKEMKTQENRKINILIIIIICILFIFLYSLIRSNINKNKINRKLIKVNEKLKKSKLIAEENSKVKSQFVSNVSHELRTPLYGVIGISQILLKNHKNDVDHNLLNSLSFSANYLMSLVNDLLQLNLIEENKIELKNNRFNLKDALLSIDHSLNYFASKNNNSLKVIHDQNIPNIIVGDELRLSQIIVNLASNSLKFTNNGLVEIKTELINRSSEFCQIKFSVKDNGIGISKENQSKIFEKFIQLDRKKTDYQGTGLGLTIVKRLLELFGSQIFLESSPNYGTIFYFTISFRYIDNNTEIENENLITMNQNIYKILVVEDNKINQIVTQKILEINNHIVTVAEDGFQAIDLLQNNSFDLILMDLSMPKIDGFETSSQIRKFNPSIPIIALTAFESSEVVDKTKGVGINEIIMKPYQPQTLFDAITRNLEL